MNQLFPNGDKVRGIFYMDHGTGKIVFLGSAPKGLFRFSKGNLISADDLKHEETLSENLAQSLDAIAKITDSLSLKFDWDTYLLGYLRQIEAHTQKAKKQLHTPQDKDND